MSETCRYCGDNPRKNCNAADNGACEYPRYKRAGLRADNERLRALVLEAARWFRDGGNPTAEEHFRKALEGK